MVKWTASEIPTQRGRISVVTGTGGLGFEDALALARAGGTVILAGRNAVKGAAAVGTIRRACPGADVRFEELDLASLASIREMARRMADQVEHLDILINNAGVMVPPQRAETSDGFELQFGTNHLGHFALTAHLLPLLRRGRQPRVVSVSSVAARGGEIDFANLNAQHTYRPMAVYSQSKLACLMFALEMQRRSVAGGWNVTSIAAHPGVSRTDLLHNGPGRWSLPGMTRSLFPFLFQPAQKGALPTLFAATAPDAAGGAYYGPDGVGEVRGYPALAQIPQRALDEVAAARLWQVSEQLTNVRFGDGS